MSLPRRVATSVAKRKLPVAVAAAAVIAIALAAVFWTLGFFTGDEPLQEETAADSPSSSEIAGNYPTPARNDFPRYRLYQASRNVHGRQNQQKLSS